MLGKPCGRRQNALPVGIACALVGVIVNGILALTGAGSTFAPRHRQRGENSLFFSLVLTMLACLVLGMGIPTIPDYIITSSIAGPARLHLECRYKSRVRLPGYRHGGPHAAGGAGPPSPPRPSARGIGMKISAAGSPHPCVSGGGFAIAVHGNL